MMVLVPAQPDFSLATRYAVNSGIDNISLLMASSGYHNISKHLKGLTIDAQYDRHIPFMLLYQ